MPDVVIRGLREILTHLLVVAAVRDRGERLPTPDHGEALLRRVAALGRGLALAVDGRGIAILDSQR